MPLPNLSISAPPAAGLLAVVVGSLTCLFLWWKPRLESKKPVESLPMLPNSQWLFGHLFWLLGKGYLDKQRDILNHSDDQGRCACWVGPTQPSVSLTSGEDAQRLLKNHHSRHSAPILRRHFEMLAGERNLLLLNGKEWKYYQSALKSALHRQTKLDPTQLRRVTVLKTRTLVKNIQAKISCSNGRESIHCSSIDEFMKMITQDVFGLVAFSHDFGCCSNLQLSEFAKAFESVEDDILDRCLHNTLLPQHLFYWIPTKRNRSLLRKRSYLRSFLRNIVHDRFSDRANNLRKNRNGDNSGKTVNANHENDDILDKLIETHNTMQQQRSTGVLTESGEDLVDILLSVLLAGYDTVSIALTYAIFLISRHQRWEALCLKEIMKNNTNFDDVNSQTEVFDLPLCRAEILEALRLYPVATALSRSLEKPLLLPADCDDNADADASASPTVTVPEGCHVGISVWLAHRSSKHFPDPLEFRPDRWVAVCSRSERWIEQKPQEREDDFPSSSSIPAGNMDAFLAFSAGARSCPGKEFALHEASLAFAVLIDGLKFRIDKDYQPEMEWKVIVQKPKGGVPASISIR